MQFRFRFVWDKVHHREHRARKLTGLLRVVEDETVEGHFRTFWFDARGLLVVVAAVAVVGWFGTAGALYAWQHRNPYNRLGYADLVLPWRWSRIPDLRGQGYIAEGLDELKAGRVPSGLLLLRQGFARHPDAAVARLVAARTYAHGGYYRGVRDVMLPQLGQGVPPREFIEFLLGAALANEDHATMVEACDRILEKRDVPTAVRGWLLERKAEALIVLERSPDALTALDAAGRGRSLDWRRFHATALIEAGRAAEAIAEIQSWPDSLPRQFKLNALIGACRRAGRFDDMAAAIRERQHLDPDQVEPWVLAIGAYARAGWRDAAWESTQEAIKRFGANEAAMGEIEHACADAEAVDLLQLCLDNARELGQSPLPALLDLAVTQLALGDHARAEQTYEQLVAADRQIREAGDAHPRALIGDSFGSRDNRSAFGRLAGATRTSGPYRKINLPPAVRDWVRTLIEAEGLPATDPAQTHLTVLETESLPPGLFTRSASMLARSGHWPAVAAVARAGLVKFPGSTPLARMGVRAADQIAAMPKPPPVAIAASEPKSGNQPTRGGSSDTTPAMPAKVDYATMAQEDFFARIDAANGKGQWSDVVDTIEAAKRAAPKWLPRVEGELSWREVRAALEQGDMPPATMAISERLRVHPLEAPRALALAREWQGRKDLETARKVADLIVAGVPEFKPGQAYLVELKKLAQPPTPPSPTANTK